MKKFALTLLAIAFFASFSVAKDKAATPKAQKISGYVSNDKCGAKDKTNAECTKKCVEAGANLVVVADKGDKIYNVDNQDALKGHEGHHVQLKAHVYADTNSIHVMSVKMLGKGAEKSSM